MRATLAALTLLTLPAAGVSGERGPQEWELLGSRRVSFAAERDAIDVGARAGAFTAIRIEVAGGDVEMYNVRLTFGNGDTWSPNTRLGFGAGSWSRTIDVPGPARFIRRIEFWYRSRIRRGQATVRVFGRTAPAAVPSPLAPPVTTPQPAAPPAAAPAEGWDHVGMRTVDFRVDHDAIVAVGQGAFRALRFDVEGGDLEMFDVKITFANGEAFSPATRLLFRQGTRSRVIDLPGDARIVRRIDFFYRSGSMFAASRGRATVHVYGRR